MMWWLVLSLFLVASADAGLMQHTALFLERDVGLSSSAVASAISATLGLGIVAKAGAGWIFDRYSLRGIGVWYLLLAISIALALSINGVLTLTLFAMARGVAHGGLMTAPALVAKHCYGPRLMNRTVALFIGVWATGAALGPVIMAATYDYEGTYRTGLLVLIAFSVVAAAALRRVQPLYRDAWKPRRP
jgi:MFS family permease